MRYEGVKRIFVAAIMALSAGAVVAYANPVQRVTHDADTQVSQLAQTARTIGDLVLGHPLTGPFNHLG
ncbi:hypothetical protein [Stakelama pacifica]|uniref:Uncharacterized protein n=1 Tax=Stakelama pacifica TaxID=517720 RepID=A0A4R6FA97_9SPHN|nr:hypothetical protein [Stakelama pacifica]MAW98237.1 hypothetical protein [Sphingomonas sp.]TDN77897.1 hypothetical protein EV664_1225 [Stakelama pacifica]GGP00617.1 hypothetical protein GCM10011329_36920 [Stakelama pacifica]